MLDVLTLDHVLEGMPGASYSVGYIEPFTTGNDSWMLFRVTDVEVKKNESSNLRTFVSYDRRHLFEKTAASLWKRTKNTPNL